ncbi:MAG TPA: DUF4282 domain-containing protein [Longimicrobiales bacterium]|nr:DUF4282 domain-containing protein [Longimicrobiales bacterium]
MSELLSFRRMITPVIIQVIFWILIVIVVISGLALVVGGDTGGQQFFGLVYLVVGPLIVRVYCELLIVIFRMNETLTRIESNTAAAHAPATAPELPTGHAP